MSVTAEILAALVKILVVIGTIMLAVPMFIWLERKLVADFQARIGPNRVGPFGLLQAFADGIKLLLKEDITPRHVDRVLFFLAPVVMMLPALTVFAVIPFGSSVEIAGHKVALVIADVPVGVLYILAITSVGVYGVVLAGWSSNNKYALLGGLRSSAQMVSYELPMGMAIVTAVLISSISGGDLSLTNIVKSQDGWFWNWNLFALFPLGLIAGTMYYICGVAETNRTPFDLPEAESELVAGYHTEYSSMKFAMFFLGEYANMLNVSAILTTLFFGGWLSPIPLQIFPAGHPLSALGSLFWFTAKCLFWIAVYIWLRATLPRLRYDRLMAYTWKGLLPVGLIMVLVTAVWLTLRHQDPSAMGGERRAESVRASQQASAR